VTRNDRARRGRVRTVAVAAVVSVVCLLGFAPAAAVPAAAVSAVVARAPTVLSSRADDTAVPNGPIQSIVRSGDTIYLGGRFDRVGPRTGPGVELGPDGTQHAGLPEIAGAGPAAIVGSGGDVSAVAADGVGGWFVAGLFSHVGGVARTNLVHLRADHSVAPEFAPVFDDSISAIAVSGSTVYVAGLFTTVDGQSRHDIAAVRSTDGGVTGFNPGANAAVEALAVSGDGSVVYAGGRFTLIGGQPRTSLAALNAADGTATATFAPVITGSVGTGVVDALAISNSILYVGGTFASLGAQPRNNVGALSLGVPTDGVIVSGFDPSPSYNGCAACASISVLAVSGSTVYIGGLFTTIGGQARSFLAGLAPDGTATAFNPAPNGNIFALAVEGQTLYVAGSFQSPTGAVSIGGQSRNFAAALRTSDATATPFNPNPNALARAIAATGSAIYLGGNFSSLGGVVRRGLAAISAVDGLVTAFDPEAYGYNGGTANVGALAVSGSTLYVGGYFGTIAGQPRGSLAALHLPEGALTDWDPRARYGTNPALIQALAATDSTLFVGGIFTTIGGQARSNIGAVSVVGATATAFDPKSDREVDALALGGSTIYAGGHFGTIGGQTRHSIAALDPTTGVATPWDPDTGLHSNVLALAVAGPVVYAGGDFAAVHGLPRTNLAGINVTDGTPTAFDPQATDPLTGGGVFAVATHGSHVYAAGFFTAIKGQQRHLLAEMDAADGAPTAFAPNGAPGFGAFALAAADDGTLYAGGSFDTLDLTYSQGFAQFTPTSAAAALPEGRPWLLLALAGLLAGVVTVRLRNA